MHVLVSGLNHTTASAALRERLAFPEEDSLREGLARLRALCHDQRTDSLAEGVILSTCHRLEIYAAAQNAAEGQRRLVEFLTDARALPSARFAPYLYHLRDEEAVRHLFIVATGLDSPVLGETQILGQVAEAREQVLVAGTAGPLLSGLFQAAVHAAKRVHRETGLNRAPLSVGHAASALALRTLPNPKDITALVIGAGEMATLAALHLRGHGVGQILVLNRSSERAQVLAQKVGGQPIAWEALPVALIRADAIICATRAPQPIIRAADVATALPHRSGRALVIVDVSVPRNVGPEAGALPGVRLAGVDEVSTAIAAQLTARRREVPKAQAILDEEGGTFLTWLRSRSVAPAIAALRARAATGRNKIIKFDGCYHGHADFLLAKAGSGVATLGLPDSPGVPVATAADTLVAPYNDIAVVERLLEAHRGQVAAIIVEPVAGNMGVVLPAPEFLPALRRLCDAHGALLVFDEVMTGFRVHPGGAQALYGIRPDLTCLGKVIGGGLPVGAYGGRADLMRMIAPSGPVYQAGTLSGNPLAMAAGIATLRVLARPGVWAALERRVEGLCQNLDRIAAAIGVPYFQARAGTVFCGFFTASPVTDYATARRSDAAAYARFFHAMLAAGVYLAPSQFEASFLSTVHGDEEIAATVAAAEKGFAAVI